MRLSSNNYRESPQRGMAPVLLVSDKPRRFLLRTERTAEEDSSASPPNAATTDC